MAIGPAGEAIARASRRRTGGQRPATRQHEPICNDSKRQGRERDRSIAAGHGTAVLAFTAMMRAVAAARV